MISACLGALVLFTAAGDIEAQTRRSGDEVTAMERHNPVAASGFGFFIEQRKFVGAQVDTIRVPYSTNLLKIVGAYWQIIPGATAARDTVAFSMHQGSASALLTSYAFTDSIPGTFWIGSAPTDTSVNVHGGMIHSLPSVFRYFLPADSALVVRSVRSAGTDTLVITVMGYEEIP